MSRVERERLIVLTERERRLVVKSLVGEVNRRRHRGHPPSALLASALQKLEAVGYRELEIREQDKEWKEARESAVALGRARNPDPTDWVVPDPPQAAQKGKLRFGQLPLTGETQGDQ
jgi:hypothetical protein